MNNDRELLQLAAKAAGISGQYDDCFNAIVYGPHSQLWIPLTDDGDALRLAVKLGLLVHGSAADSTVFCQVGECPDAILEKAKPDPYAATRRAIVRAAASIGETM